MAIQRTTLRDKKNTLTLDQLHLNKESREKINQLIEEFTFINALKKYDIPVANKVLLHGHTGCGKTATAHAIGKSLEKEVVTLNLGGFVSSRLGETGKNVTEVFRKASFGDTVLFIDEFDFIGKIRDYDNQDSGEMKRLVNTLIQQIDQLPDDTLLICATNHVEVIDTALLRRFQVKLKYELPSNENIDVYYDAILARFPQDIACIQRVYGISYAEAKDVAYQQIKTNIIQLEKQLQN
ncbi:MAG: ATP-binding protein [Tetragenococcus koreensis]|nr:ATP-binding protein [Tetragenococcus koreensis]MDN6310266.1 ATP-binding protein [Psychroflexus sp.]